MAGDFIEMMGRRLAVARGDVPADLVLAGGTVLSVFTGETFEADVAVVDGYVAGLGSYPEGGERVDVRGLTLVPGFIDGHMHIESTKLMMDQFARAVLPCGTTTAVLDPHEIVNVFGFRSIQDLLAAAAAVPFDFFVMASPCVPASPFESSGAVVDAAGITRFFQEEPRALGIAELMNFPGTVAGDEDILAKIDAARQAGRHIDGHAPGLSGNDLCAYVAAGANSDHECTELQEALEKRRLGMWIMIREGSATRNARTLMPLVLEHGSRNCMLVTDDREANHIRRDGHVNDLVQIAIEMGVPPAEAIVMATLHPAQWHRLHEHGAVAPGYLADIVALPDLTTIRPVKVWKRGRLVAEEGMAIGIPEVATNDWMRGSVHVRTLSSADFRIDDGGPGDVRAIKVLPYDLYTRAVVVEPSRADGVLLADPGRDLAKVAVIERHHETGRIGRGFVTGFGLDHGAIASTHAHDAHNVVVIGVDEGDMAVAVNRLVELGGGQVAVRDGRVLAEVPCPIAGLLSDLPFERVADAMDGMENAAQELGVDLPHSFMAMSLLALSVLPELRITDHGLVDVGQFKLVPLEV